MKHGDAWASDYLERLKKEAETFYEERGYLAASIDFDEKTSPESNSMTAVEIELVDTANPQQKIVRITISDSDQSPSLRRSSAN